MHKLGTTLVGHRNCWKNVGWTSWSPQRTLWQPNGPWWGIGVKGIF
jgi:hypothetical protein